VAQRLKSGCSLKTKLEMVDAGGDDNLIAMSAALFKGEMACGGLADEDTADQTEPVIDDPSTAGSPADHETRLEVDRAFDTLEGVRILRTQLCTFHFRIPLLSRRVYHVLLNMFSSPCGFPWESMGKK
jgi:hypothetical protein